MSTSTLINDPFMDDPGAILEWLYGDCAGMRYIHHLMAGQRRGQAFMNVLFEFDSDSYVRLTGSLWDPFYVDEKIPSAIDKLTSK
jgi:hypothetical protein